MGKKTRAFQPDQVLFRMTESSKNIKNHTDNTATILMVLLEMVLTL